MVRFSVSAWLRQPARVIGAAIFQSSRQFARVAAIGIHDPKRGRFTSGSAAEDDLPAIGRFTGAEVPDWWVGASQARNRTIARIETADFGAATRQLQFEVPVKMVSVGPLRLKFPWNF